jgi:hypothetical protein
MTATQQSCTAIHSHLFSPHFFHFIFLTEPSTELYRGENIKTILGQSRDERFTDASSAKAGRQAGKSAACTLVRKGWCWERDDRLNMQKPKKKSTYGMA